MSLEVIKSFAESSGDETILNAVKSVEESFKSNLDRISFLEKDMKKAVEKRDGLKNLVTSKLGVEDVSEETLDRFLSSTKSTSADSEKLTQMIEALKSEKDNIANQLTSTVNSYKIERMLSDIGGRNETQNARAYEILLSEISNGVNFDENGNIFFKAKDGTTLRNEDGKPMTMEDRYNSIRESENFSFLFKEKKSKSGGGMSPAKVSDAVGGKSRGSMTHGEKAAYIKQYGQDAYLKLPN